MNNDFLAELGWNDEFQIKHLELDPELTPGRIVMESRGWWRVLTEKGELLCRVSGTFFRNAVGQEDTPVVGDWALLRPNDDGETGIIHNLLPRSTSLSRKAADTRTGVQVIAANIETAFIIQGLDDNFNLRRLERYLIMVREGGVNPVILLNKADLNPDNSPALEETRNVAKDAAIVLLSALNRTGLEAVREYIRPGKACCLIGSSGVGKSTLINALLGEEAQKVQEVRAGDSKGRHTTTVRQLFRLPDGGLLIDTPGMRELQLWDSGDVEESFPEIEELAGGCRFNDCTHEHEPGCAVLEAVEKGNLEADRVASFRKLQSEGSQLDKTKKQQLAYKRRMEEKEIAKRRNELRRMRKPKKKKK